MNFRFKSWDFRGIACGVLYEEIQVVMVILPSQTRIVCFHRVHGLEKGKPVPPFAGVSLATPLLLLER